MSFATEKGSEASIGLRLAIAWRLTVSYAVSLAVVGLITGWLVVPAAGAVLSWPLYLVALVGAIIFTKSILAHPATWTAAAVFLASVACLLILPFDWNLFSIATVGVFCAFVAGVCFYAWNRCFPLQPMKS